MTCANCHQESATLTYNTRYCGCHLECTHGICERCDEWKDELKLTEEEAREL